MPEIDCIWWVHKVAALLKVVGKCNKNNKRHKAETMWICKHHTRYLQNNKKFKDVTAQVEHHKAVIGACDINVHTSQYLV